MPDVRYGPFSVEEDAIYYQELAANYAAFAACPRLRSGVSTNNTKLTERFQQASAYFSAMAREALFRFLSLAPEPGLLNGKLSTSHRFTSGQSVQPPPEGQWRALLKLSPLRQQNPA